MVNVLIDASGLERAAKSIANIPGALKKAEKYALSRTGNVVRTTAVRETIARYYVKGTDLRKKITLKKTAEQVQMIVRGKRHTLAAYKLSPMRKPKRRKYNLRGAAKRSEPIEDLGPRAFLMPITGKHPFIPMRRKGTARLPIEAVRGPAYPEIVSEEETLTPIQQEALKAWEQEFKRQALRALGVLA